MTTANGVECERAEEEIMMVDDECGQPQQEEAMRYLSILLQKEADVYPPVPQDFLRSVDITGNNRSGGDSSAGEVFRCRLCEWCFEVADHFHFDREVVSYALQYLDRTIAAFQSGPPLSKRQIQLIAVTSLYMAIKIHGETDDVDVDDSTSAAEVEDGHLPPRRRKLRIDAYVTISHGFFTVETIEAMERKILEVLEWNVNPPTGYQFITALLDQCPTSCCSKADIRKNITDVARYLSELSVCASYFSSMCKTSVTAYASILCAMEALPHLPSNLRDTFVANVAEATGLRPDDEDVQRACTRLKLLCPSLFVSSSTSMMSEGIVFVDAASDNNNNNAAAAADAAARFPNNRGLRSPVSVVIEDDTEPYSHRMANRGTSSSSPPQQEEEEEGQRMSPSSNSGRKRSRSSDDKEEEEEGHHHHHHHHHRASF